MIINRNTLGHLEEPDFILVKASEERVGVLKCTHKTWLHKFNDMDTISFEIPYLTDDVLTSFYEDIDVMKYVEVPTIGRFCIKDIEIVNEGTRTEYKKVDCVDYSSLLGQRYLEDFYINTGKTGSIDGVALAPDGDQEHSLLYLILEKLPEWSYGYIAPSLRTMKRSFEITKQDVYSFMTQDISNAFECIFEFDSLNKLINVYEEDSTHWTDTNIHVSYNSLLERTEMNYSTDDIKTAVKLKGDGELDVREINMGNDYIYNFEYYASTEFMSSSLLTAYNNWMNLVNTIVDLSLFDFSRPSAVSRSDLQGKTYKQAFSVLLQKYQDCYTSISKWTSTMLPYGINTRKNPGKGTISYREDGSDAVTLDDYTSVVLVDSLPSSGEASVLYLIKDTNNMYRWKNRWIDVNKWDNCCLNELRTLLASAEKLKAVAQKRGYGSPYDVEGKEDTTLKARYIDTYLPPVYMYNAIEAQIKVVQTTIDSLNMDQTYIQKNKNVVVTTTSMQNNFTTAQLKELSTFIREDEITSNNFLVTDTMTETERFNMLDALLEYGEEELAKVCVPQIQFSADLVNLFAIPEFDTYAGSFDIGNYVWITLRDDYSIKAKILEVELDFLDQGVFNVTFGNIMKKARNIFTDVTEALNIATSAATSVSFNASNWNASAEETDSIGQALADGLLGQAYYIASPNQNETQIDENGVWITTIEGEHGRNENNNYDAIYLGGGRMLYTQDGWRTVSMSVGRADVKYPHVDKQTGNIVINTESRFGVFADFLIAGYVGGSIIVGGDIYSDAYKTTSNPNSGNFGTHISLTEGTFEFNSPQSFEKDGKPGKKRLRLYTKKDANNNDVDVLELNGVIHASEGNIGSNDNGENGFIIKYQQLYSTKTSWTDGNNDGIYINSSTDGGIALGKYYTDPDNVKRNPFQVNMKGELSSTSGYIGGYTIRDKKLYCKKETFNDASHEGIFLGSDVSSDPATRKSQGISIGKYDSSKGRNPFSVDMDGYLTSISGYIGGFNITNTYLDNGKDSLNTTSNGIYLGIDGISLGASTYDSTTQKWTDHKFRVTNEGALWSTSGKIGGWSIGTDTISHKSGSNTITLSAKDNNLSFNDKIVLNGDGSLTTSSGKFSVSTDGKIHATGGDIGGFTITDSELYNGKKSLNATSKGVYVGTTGISLGTTTSAGVPKFRVTDAGELTSTSGTIGGWSISNSTLTGGDMTINSNGSMKHNDNTWYINSDGSATFKSITLKSDVHITGVQDGSTFGNDFGWSNGINWGNFAGGSTYNSSIGSPFGGTCVDHIKTLAVDEVIAKKADIGYLEADDIKTINITAENLKVKAANISGTLTASQINTDGLRVGATNVTGGATAYCWTGYDREQLSFTDGDGVSHTINYVDHLTGHYKLTVLAAESQPD